MKQNLLNPFVVQKTLLGKNIRIFNPEEFRRVFSISPIKTKYFLETYARKGLFTRIKKGLYALKNQFPSEEEIANAIYKPSYISFEYALAKYGIIPEMVYVVTSATPKPTRSFSANDKEFHYFTIEKKSFTGYFLMKEKDKSFLIAEPEKALVDYLYFVSLGRKTFNDRLAVSNLKKEKIIRYARFFNRPGLLNLVKKL